MHIRHYFLSLFCLFVVGVVSAQKSGKPAPKGHDIRVRLTNYESGELVLGFYFGDKPYVKDTARIGPDGYFRFSADTLLPCGVYLLVTKPDNSFIQVLLDDKNQQLTLTTDYKDAVAKMQVKGSEDNARFYAYLQYLGKMRPEADTLRAQMLRAAGNKADSLRFAAQIEAIDKQVRKYQKDLLEKYPQSMSAKIIRASLDVEIPDNLQGTDEKETQQKKYYWYRAHYFDNMDLADPCMLRSPVMHGRIEQYIGKVIPQHPDSINAELDRVLRLIRPSNETFKFYLIHYLNHYAKSNIVGMDACYVHLAKNYYCTGSATWANKEDLEKICDNANRLEPLLVGKKAPNLTIKDRSGKPVTLWEVDAPFTVLFFWDPECGICKKSAPFMVDFAKKYKEQGVKVIAICTAVTDKAPECWKSVEEKGFTDDLFINLNDPFLQSRYKTLYDVRTTPQIYVLDRDKEILVKRIGAEQLLQVMDDIIKFNQERKGR